MSNGENLLTGSSGILLINITDILSYSQSISVWIQIIIGIITGWVLVKNNFIKVKGKK